MAKIVRTLFNHLNLSKHRISDADSGLTPAELSCCKYVVFLGQDARDGSEAIGNLCAIFVPPKNCFPFTKAFPSISQGKGYTAYCLGVFVKAEDGKPAILWSPRHAYQINTAGYTYYSPKTKFVRCSKVDCPGVIEEKELAVMDDCTDKSGLWTKCPLSAFQWSADRGKGSLLFFFSNSLFLGLISMSADLFGEKPNGEDEAEAEAEPEKEKKKKEKKKKSKKEATSFSGKITLADLKGKQEEEEEGGAEPEPMAVDEKEDDAGNIFFSVYRELGGKHDKQWVREYSEKYPSRLNGHQKGTQLKLIKHPDGGECKECGIDLTSRWRKHQETCEDKACCNSCYWSREVWQGRTVHWPVAFRDADKLPEDVIVCPRGGACEYCEDEPFNQDAEAWGADPDAVKLGREKSAQQGGKKRKRPAPKKAEKIVDSEDDDEEDKKKKEEEEERPKKKKKQSRKKTGTIIIEDEDEKPHAEEATGFGKNCIQCNKKVRVIKGNDLSRPLCPDCFDSLNFKVPTLPSRPPPSLPSTVTGPWAGINLQVQDVTSSPALSSVPPRSSSSPEWNKLSLPDDPQPMVIDPRALEWFTSDDIEQLIEQGQVPDRAAEEQREAEAQALKLDEQDRKKQEDEEKKQTLAKAAEDRLKKQAEEEKKRLEEEEQDRKRHEEDRAEIKRLEEEKERLQKELAEKERLEKERAETERLEEEKKKMLEERQAETKRLEEELKGLQEEVDRKKILRDTLQGLQDQGASVGEIRVPQEEEKKKKKRQPRRKDDLEPIDESILNEGRKTRSRHNK